MAHAMQSCAALETGSCAKAPGKDPIRALGADRFWRVEDCLEGDSRDPGKGL